ncbi:response regulator transcription factor [Cohnella thermotolerans]|uniref:response regulator transcription factor n=1 Tax=Cohnella thermotolerans TaxID=329858 RepID=UPI0003F671C3|nr:response regulator [Cohnella thermotolerans]
MNVLIVDDEQHVREAVKLLVDWKSLGIEGVYEAGNGAEASAIIERLQPEIVVTDMRMPVQDGVGLLAWIDSRGLPIQKIVISGHDDFELVRSTMKYGGQDYLLKPIDPDQLHEALRKAAENWRKEDGERKLMQRRNIEMNQLKPVYWDKIFSNLVTEPGCYATVRDSLYEEFGLDADSRCQVVVVGIDTLSRELTRKFERNRDLLFFSLTNICNEFLRPDNRGIACRYWISEHEVLLLFWDRFAELRETLARIDEGFRTALRCRFHFGIGTLEPFPAGVGPSYRAARAALRRRSVLAADTRFHAYEPDAKPSAGSPRPFDHEESFRLAVLSGSEAEIRAAVGRWMNAVRGLPELTLEQLELWRHEFGALRERWEAERSGSREEASGAASSPARGAAAPLGDAAATGSDANAGDPWGSGSAAGSALTAIPLDEDGCLSLPRWEEDLTAALLRIAERQSAERKERNVMAEIARYIEANYYRELTLQDIAGQFYLSREYISRRFKQIFGENLSDFLARVRIERAKTLLGNPALKIAEVAEKVGFSDEKYFSKVFKKFAGVSPNQFRKS